MLMGRKSWLKRDPVARLGLVACLAVAPLRFAGAQDLIQAGAPGGPVRLFNGDTAILESTDNRKDLPCTVTPEKPSLGFDLKFHAGYEVSVPVKELAGAENHLTMVFRVTRPDGWGDGIYLSQHTVVPATYSDLGGPCDPQRRMRPRRRSNRWIPAPCFRSCGASRASRASAGFRLSRTTCRSSGCFTGRMAPRKSIFRRWATR